MHDEQVATQLGFLLGSFRGNDVIHASAWSDAMTATAVSEGTTSLGGTVVTLTLDETRPDGSRFEVLNVFCRDPADGSVLLYAFDSLGYPPDPPARGAWLGHGLVLERTTPRGRGRTTFEATPDGFAWSRTFQAPDGDRWQTVVQGELTRLGPVTTTAASS